MKTNFKNLEIYDNYITNISAIIDLLETKYKNSFMSREMKEKYFSLEKNPNGGDVLLVSETNRDLFNAIFETIDKKITPNYPDLITIYRYYPGSFLQKHRDTALDYQNMITDLTFLQSSSNHLKIYTNEHKNGYLVQENPGRRIIMPEDLEHEITTIEDNEITRYTMTMTWLNSRPNISWWSERK
jgi:hypothetical protein